MRVSSSCGQRQLMAEGSRRIGGNIGYRGGPNGRRFP